MQTDLILFLTVLTALNAICNAYTKETHFQIHNHTPDPARLIVSDVKKDEWDGRSRPMNNLHQRRLYENGMISQREEVNLAEAFHKFTLSVKFENGKKLVLRIDQGFAIDNSRNKPYILDGNTEYYYLESKAENDNLFVHIKLAHASRKSYFEIHNDTPESAILIVRHVDSNEWHGVSRPDKNLNNQTLSENTLIRKPEELNNHARSHMFTLGVEFENGNKLGLRIDQGLASGNFGGDVLKLDEGGGGTEKVIKDLIALMDDSKKHGGRRKLYIAGNTEDYHIRHSSKGGNTLKVHIRAA